MPTYNKTVTFTMAPAFAPSNTETQFSQGFITLVSVSEEYRVTLVEVTGG